ncbi:MAG: hypothetical protein HOK28_15315 [Deltaproteobacteria bacterium]|jgi:hypothetical protein|nr:hypothetical protein [Deltaproteobacteria bacterium]
MRILSTIFILTLLAACGSETDPANTSGDTSSDNATETQGDTTSSDDASQTSGDETTDDVNTDTDTDTDTNNDTNGADTNSSDSSSSNASDTVELAPLFEGTYAFKKWVTTLQEVPMMGSSENVTTGWGYTQITFDGTDLWLTEHGCHVESTGMDAVSTEIPDAIPQSMVPAPVKLLVWKEGETVRWEREQAVMLVGVELDNPLTDELPGDASDERIFDQDGDGNPGVTVKVAGFISGDIYVVQRAINTYYGTLDDQGALAGNVTERGDQKTLGATNAMLEQAIPNEPVNDPAKNQVQMVRIEPSMNCELLMNSVDSIF